MPVENLEQSNVVVVEDLRPEAEAKEETFGDPMLNAIYRIDQSYINPSAARLLAHRVFEKFPELVDVPLIKLHHLVVYANLRYHLLKQVIRRTSVLGLLDGSFFMNEQYQLNQAVFSQITDATFFDDTAKKEYLRSFYTEEENPDNTPVYLIYIDTEMLGKRIASRCLMPVLSNKDGSAYEMTEKTDTCIEKHLALYSTTPSAEQ